MNAGKYDDTILQYTAALSLEPFAPQDLLIKRSKACARMGGWEGALNDANEVAHYQIVLLPSANGTFSGYWTRSVLSNGLREEA